MKIPRVIAFGQAGVDFVGREQNTSLKEMLTFEKAAGGTPANVAVGLAKLRISVMFFGKVGDDSFGHFLADTLQANGVDVSELRFERTAKTTIGFESTLEEPELLIYGAPGPHILIRKDEVSERCFQENSIFHFGSMTLTHNPGREATFFAADLAIKKGLFISFDPNLRLSIWSNVMEAKETVKRALEKAHLVKLSFDEFKVLSGFEETERINDFRSEYDIDLLFITLGAKGSFYCNRYHHGFAKCKKVEVLDTTGAGDGFCAGLLYKVIQLNAADSISLSNLTEEQLIEITEFANAAGALTTMRLGVIPALPTIEKINTFMQGHRGE